MFENSNMYSSEGLTPDDKNFEVRISLKRIPVSREAWDENCGQQRLRRHQTVTRAT